MTKRTYTEEQRDEACLVYVEHGPSEAQRRTGIPTSTLHDWAQQRGIRTVRNQKTAEATEAAALDARAKRASLQCLLLDRALDALYRMDEPHTAYVGKEGRAVTWDKAPPEAMRHYATVAGIMIDKLRLEEGSVTARTEQVDPQQRAMEVLDQLAARRAKSTPPKPPKTTL